MSNRLRSHQRRAGLQEQHPDQKHTRRVVRRALDKVFASPAQGGITPGLKAFGQAVYDITQKSGQDVGWADVEDLPNAGYFLRAGRKKKMLLRSGTRCSYRFRIAPSFVELFSEPKEEVRKKGKPKTKATKPVKTAVAKVEGRNALQEKVEGILRVFAEQLLDAVTAKLVGKK